MTAASFSGSALSALIIDVIRASVGVGPADPIIVLAGVAANSASNLHDICRQRCRRSAALRAPIIILAFESSERLRSEPGGALLGMPGCLYQQLPVSLRPLRERVAALAPLTIAEWDEVRQTLGPTEVREYARCLRHALDTDLAEVLMALGELEKFSYFASPTPHAIEEAVLILDRRLDADAQGTISARLEALTLDAHDLCDVDLERETALVRNALAEVRVFRRRLNHPETDRAMLREAGAVADRVQAGLDVISDIARRIFTDGRARC